MSPKLIIDKTVETTSIDLVVHRDRTVKSLFLNSDELTSAPQPPQNLSVTAFTATTVDLDWDAPSFGTHDDYTVYVYNNTQNTLEQTITGIVLSEADVVGLTTDDEYEFWIVAVKDSIESSETSHVTEIPRDVVAPATPTGLNATAEDTQVILDWDDNAEPDLAGYNVYIDGVAHANNPYLTSEATITGLTNGVEYDFQVSAFDDSGNESTLSAIVSSTPVASVSNTHSLSFGGNDWVDTGVTLTSLVDSALSAFTIEFNLKTTQTSVFSVTGFAEGVNNFTIEFNRSATSNPDINFIRAFFRDNDGNRIVFALDSAFNFTDGTWHHFAFKRTGLNTFAVLIDGVERGITHSIQESPDNFVLTQNLYVGARNNGGTSDENLTGLVDDFRVWNVFRSNTEIINNLTTQLEGNETGLVLYYKFNEGSGGIAQDATANNNDGGINGASFSTDISFNKFHLLFDGVNDDVLVSSAPIGASFTCEIWAKSPNINWNEFEGMVSARINSGFMIHPDAGAKTWRGYIFDDSGAATLIDQIAVADITIWHHYALAWDDSTNTGKMFLDGVEVGTITSSITRTGNSGNMNIGLGTGGGGGRYLNAFLDEVRIWNVARTQAQISDNMDKEFNGNEAGLVGYYKFNRSDGDTAIDSAGGNNGIINGSTITQGNAF